MQEFKLEELEAATENFSQSQLVGKGSHGHVYRGVLQQDHQLVAVKKQSLGLQKVQDNSKLENEVAILSSLQPQNKNLYLINLIGISYDSFKNKVLVMEYMPNGTLHEMLHVASSPPSWPKRVEIAIQIAKAVKFLHEEISPSIIHRDIKSTNILFDSDWNPKLADFGLAIRINDHSKSLPAGTIGYLDPSYTVPSKLSTKIDVFSFGVLLLEIVSAQKVINVSRSPSSLVEWAVPLIERSLMFEIYDKRVHLPRFAEGTINNMLTIASRCVKPSEENRPSMKQILFELENCIVFEPVIRIPAWMNLLQNLSVLIKRQVKIICAKKLENSSSFTSASAITSCEANQENDDDVNMSRGKILLREILADQCF